MRRITRPFVGIGLLLPLLFGCAGEPADRPASSIRIDIDKSEPRRLLQYYFGGYVSPVATDPFRAGLLVERGNRYYLVRDSLEHHFPDGAETLTDANSDSRIDWDELELFIGQTYYQARSLPATLDSLKYAAGFDTGEWITVDVRGVMTTALRKIHVRREAIRSALENFRENERQLLYPDGTTFIAEHVESRDTVETTVMRKRPDGFWDFAVYGRNGLITAKTATPPKELRSPTQCVGCHFGSKQFEPERSFPAHARPGPHGPRQIYVDDALRDLEVVRYFDEHGKRSDTVLGLYGTLFVSRLRAEREHLSEDDAALINSFGL